MLVGFYFLLVALLDHRYLHLCHHGYVAVETFNGALITSASVPGKIQELDFGDGMGSSLQAALQEHANGLVFLLVFSPMTFPWNVQESFRECWLINKYSLII